MPKQRGNRDSGQKIIVRIVAGVIAVLIMASAFFFAFL